MPPSTAIAADGRSVFVAPMTSVPPVTVVPPEKVLAPVSVSVPAPDLAKAPPERMAETVPLSAVMDWARPQVLPVLVVPAGGHFFHGQLPLLKSLVVRHLAS